jgi:N-acetylmuramoyl-L-alanine amidase
VSLEINGHPVEVKPNGAYLAWLPVPAGTNPIYRLVARRGTDSASMEHAVRTWRSPVPVFPARPAAQLLTAGA